MIARASKQETKSAATKRTVSSKPQAARGENSKTNGGFANERRAPHPMRRKDDVKPMVNDEARTRKARKAPTIGDCVNKLLLKGKSTDEILKAVAKKFPDAHTSTASVAWYRSKLNTQGKH